MNEPIKSEALASQSLDELLFEHRNKTYGAFALRQSYQKTIRRATVLGVSLFTIALITPTIYANFKPKEERHVEVNFDDFKVETPPPQKEEIITPPPQKEEIKTPPTTKFFEPEILPDDQVPNDEPPPTQDQLANAPAGHETVEGNPDAVIEIVEPTEGEGKKEVITIEKEPEEAIMFAEQQPEFPGGTSEMNKFLSKHIKYPNPAQRAGIAGRVFMTFVVAADGTISRVEVMKGLGFGCDEEALRVIKLMPAWKPGKQSGRAVPVKFTIPVYFQLE